MTMRRTACILSGIACLASVAHAQDTLATERVFSGIQRPIFIGNAGDADRLFLVQQRGLIRILDLNTNTLLPDPFIDLSGLVSQSGNERGLLGLAFHPDYDTNGLFYVNYTHISTGATVVAQFNVSSANPDVADPNSFVQILTYTQPFSNHNGGWIGFGPDEYLYIASGDGGSANDPGNRAQTIDGMLLGKMLRIDINDDDFPGDTERNYAIPATNPFVGVAGDDEIWAYGLRNPWRSSFDRATGDLYIADVGQGSLEEIDFQPATSTGGENYGWRCMEGTQCTGMTGCVCFDSGLTDPIHEYSHAFGCSVTGGYVYRGNAIPHLRGTYFFADYCDETIWSFRYEGGVKSEFADRTTELGSVNGGFINSIVSFGEDAAGEMYICDLNGEIFRIIPRCRADINGDGMVNTQDVLAFLNLWNADDLAADINGDGLTNTQDVLAYLNLWNAGCP